MKKRFATLLALSFTLIGGCSKDYVQMCKDVYEEINNLPCMKTNERYNIDEMCPESYNESGYNYDNFFQCIKENRTCKDGVYVDDIANCVVK